MLSSMRFTFLLDIARCNIMRMNYDSTTWYFLTRSIDFLNLFRHNDSLQKQKINWLAHLFLFHQYLSTGTALRNRLNLWSNVTSNGKHFLGSPARLFSMSTLFLSPSSDIFVWYLTVENILSAHRMKQKSSTSKKPSSKEHTSKKLSGAPKTETEKATISPLKRTKESWIITWSTENSCHIFLQCNRITFCLLSTSHSARSIRQATV